MNAPPVLTIDGLAHLLGYEQKALQAMLAELQRQQGFPAPIIQPGGPRAYRTMRWSFAAVLNWINRQCPDPPAGGLQAPGNQMAEAQNVLRARLQSPITLEDDDE